MKFFDKRILAGCLLLFCSPAEGATLTITTTGTNPGNVAVIPGPLCSPGPRGGTCVFTVASGTTIRLAANSVATPGIFSAGTGDAVCAPTSTCRFMINTDSSIVATFTAGVYPSVQIGLGGVGKGDVGADNNRCQNFELGFSLCRILYGTGSEVTLDGRSVAGGIFAGFSGGTAGASSCGATNPCVFPLTVDSVVTANFAALTSLAVGPGIATIEVGQRQGFTASGTFTNGATRSVFGGSGSWSTMRSMSAPRFSLAAGVVNQRLYAVGGVNGAPLNRVEVYNPAEPPHGASDSWTTKASMLTPRSALAVAVLGGDLYALGGHTSGSVPVASVEAYNASTDTWMFKAPMPGARAGLAAAFADNIFLYAVGGGDNAAPLDTLEAYNPATNSWTTLAPMPTARTGLAAAAISGVLYAIGGFDGVGNVATVEAYDPAILTWTPMSPMPTPRTLLAVAVIDGVIYAVGGQGSAVGAVEAYNPATDTWTTLGPMPTPRLSLAVGALDGRIFAVGGMIRGDPFIGVSTHEAFRPPEATWWSSDSEIATIDQTAFATGVSAGTSTIGVRSVGIDCALTDQCAILMVSPPPPPLVSLGSHRSDVPRVP